MPVRHAHASRATLAPHALATAHGHTGRPPLNAYAPGPSPGGRGGNFSKSGGGCGRSRDLRNQEGLFFRETVASARPAGSPRTFLPPLFEKLRILQNRGHFRKVPPLALASAPARRQRSRTRRWAKSAQKLACPQDHSRFRCVGPDPYPFLPVRLCDLCVVKSGSFATRRSSRPAENRWASSTEAGGEGFSGSRSEPFPFSSVSALSDL